MSETIWVFAEQQDGELPDSTLELVCEGRRLSDIQNLELSVILFGHQVKSSGEELSAYGADNLYLSDEEILKSYHPENYTDLLAGLVSEYKPGILLFSSSANARDLGPRVAARLNTTLVPNCDKLSVSDEGRLLQTRLIQENTVHSTIECPDANPQIASVTQGIAKISKPSTKRETKIIEVDPEKYIQPGTQKIAITGFIKADPKTIDIIDAALIVSGGKGVEHDEGFQLIRDLAEVLEATVAGSRMAVDNQWIDRDRQIGQSGKTVSPDLMISCGVSGANAHIYGMRDTKTLIAINKDKAAPLMKMADLGVVGDLHEILPELINRLKDIKPAGSS